MANLKITQLPSASVATGSDVLPIVQGGVTDQITVTNLGKGILELGLSITGSTVTANSNGAGTNFRVGDDVWIGDVNLANTMQVAGQQDATKGFIKFSSGSNSPIIGSSGGNIFQITGSVNITGSGYINGDEILTSADTGSFVSTSSYGYYGTFYSTQSQFNPIPNVSHSLFFENLDVANGVTVVSQSRLTVGHSGIYNIQFSTQFNKADNGTSNVYIWLKKNGTNVPDSAGDIQITKASGGPGGKYLAAWNYLVSLESNDFLEVVWQSDNIEVTASSYVASGNIPAIPSTIVTLTQAG